MVRVFIYTDIHPALPSQYLPPKLLAVIHNFTHLLNPLIRAHPWF